MIDLDADDVHAQALQPRDGAAVSHVLDDDRVAGSKQHLVDKVHALQ